MNQIKIFIFTLTILITSTAVAAGQPAKNYIYFPNREAGGSNIRKDKALSDPRLEGRKLSTPGAA